MKAAAELVFIPCPGLGHLLSMVEMAKRLIARDHRISITLLIMKLPMFDKSKVVSTTQSLLLTAANDRLKLVHLPQEDPAVLAGLLSKGPENFILEFVKLNKPHVRDQVKKMMATESTELTESSRLAGFVVDMFCTPMIDVAAELGLPTYAYFTSGCAYLSLHFHLETLHRDHNQDLAELKDSDAELRVPGFVNSVPAKVLPSMALSKEAGSEFFMDISSWLRGTEGILVNTFEELESYTLKCLAKDDKIPPIYPVGPVLHPVKEEVEEEEIHIMKWLDEQPPSSVVFLCFGSMGAFEGDQVREIAQGLEQSKHRFLWSIREPPLKGKIAIPGEYQDLSQVLPEGFLERTMKIGKVTGWAPQVAVLSHKAVGGFVSHCGWNSVLESLRCGVPIATWPMYAEQQLNAFQLVRELGLAVEISLDYRKDINSGESDFVTADKIENGIRKMMENEHKSREEIKQKVKEISEKSKTAVEEGGSSYNYIGHFIEVVMTNAHSP